MDTALKQLKRRVESGARRMDDHAPRSGPRRGRAAGRRRCSASARRVRRRRGSAAGFATGSRRVLRLPGLQGDRRGARPRPGVRRAARHRRRRPGRRAWPACCARSRAPPGARPGATPGAPALAAAAPDAEDRRRPADAARRAADARRTGRRQPAADDVRSRHPTPARPTRRRRRADGAEAAARGRRRPRRTGAAEADGRRRPPSRRRRRGPPTARRPGHAEQRGAAAVALTIGVDIGGTKVLGGVVDPDGDGARARAGGTRRPTTSPRPAT